MKTRGDAAVIVLVVLGLVGLGAFIFKPKFLHGDTKRAEASAEASAAVEKAAVAQSSAAAASVVKIGEANAEAPASPARDFISREVPLALTFLSPPDAAKLIEAERRKVAVMSGQLEESRRLYGDAAQKAARMQAERDEANARREAVDRELAEVAAARRAIAQQRAALIVVASLLLAAWGYAKFFSITPATLGGIAAQIRAGVPAITAMDDLVPHRLRKSVRTASQLATEPKDTP